MSLRTCSPVYKVVYIDVLDSTMYLVDTRKRYYIIQCTVASLCMRVRACVCVYVCVSYEGVYTVYKRKHAV